MAGGFAPSGGSAGAARLDRGTVLPHAAERAANRRRGRRAPDEPRALPGCRAAGGRRLGGGLPVGKRLAPPPRRPAVGGAGRLGVGAEAGELQGIAPAPSSNLRFLPP